MKRRTEMRLQRWNINHLRWQDIVALLAGVWLIATVAAQIATVSLAVGGLTFIGGALIVLVGAATLDDDSPALSWAVAAGGLLAVIAAIIAAVSGEMFAFWSVAVGGGVVLFAAVWSGALKRRESRRVTQRADRRRRVHA